MSSRYRRPSSSLLVRLVLLCALVCAPTSIAFAQDDDEGGGMTFGVDETEDDDGGGDDGGDDEGGGMTFGVEEDDEGDGADEGEGDGGMEFGVDETVEEEETDETYVTAVLAVPSDDIDDGQRAELQNALVEAAQPAQNLELTGPDELLARLREEGDVMTCITEPLCLSFAGNDVGSQRVLLGRIRKAEDGTYELNVELFDVAEKLFVRSKTTRDLGSVGKSIDAVPEAVREVLDIRETITDPNGGGEAGSGTVQKVAAYTTAGLAVISIGLGAYTGLQVNSEVNAIESRQTDGTYPDLTQVQARDEAQRIQQIATRANIFYGIGAALGVASAVLFYIDTGSDVATEEELASEGEGIRDLRIAPSVSADGLGVGASFRF